MKSSSRGFSLVEVLIAVAVAIIVGYFCLRLAGSVLHTLTITTQRFAGSSTLSALEGRWLNEEDDAWAIFTPPNDVNGNSNSDGHEVDFFNRDIKHQAKFWAYTYDANAKTLTRYVYSSIGAAPSTDEVFGGITSFYAQTYPLTALQDPSSKIYAPVYASANLQNGAVQFFASTAPWVAGGNQITYLRVQTANAVREMHLSTWTAPSGWTVVLNYTPRPTGTPAPTSTPTSLAAWPAFVELPVNGKQLQTSSVMSRRGIAFYLNNLLGGGVAMAAIPPCAVNQGRAFRDSAFTVVDANDRDPFGLGLTTDAGGCISGPNGANVALDEPGYTGTFFRSSGSTCDLAVRVVSYSPASAQGPKSSVVTSGTSASSSCAVSWQDQNTPVQTAAVGFEVTQLTCNSNNICAHTSHVDQTQQCTGPKTDRVCTNTITADHEGWYASIDGGYNWIKVGAQWSNDAKGATCQSGQSNFTGVAMAYGYTYLYTSGVTAGNNPSSSWSPSVPPGWNGLEMDASCP